jgi:hypothetical protein
MFDLTRSKRRARLGLLTLALALAGATAHAQPSEQDKQAARALMAKGRSEREAGNLTGALASFSQAHAIMHVPTTLLEMARSQVALGQWLEALALVRQLHDRPAQPGEPAAFARARSEAEELGRKLEMRMPTLHLDLSGSPQPEATSVLIDEAPRADCTQACWVNPGTHVVVARARTAKAEEQLSAAEGETLRLELVFSPDLPDPRRTRPIGEEEAKPATATERSGSRTLPLSVWVLGGVAVAGVGAGTVFGLSAVAQRDELRDSCAPHCSADRVDGVRRRALAANLSFGLGAAAAAAALASYVFLPAAASPAPVARRSAGSGPLKRLHAWGAPLPAGGYAALQADF